MTVAVALEKLLVVAVCAESSIIAAIEFLESRKMIRSF
jgi:hypothetical protein